MQSRKTSSRSSGSIENLYPQDARWKERRPRGPYTDERGVFVKDAPEPDHPCSAEQLPKVPDPAAWRRRENAARCPNRAKVAMPQVLRPDVGLIDVRPNVRKGPEERGCRTEFEGWSIRSLTDGCVVALVQDVWLLGARLEVAESGLDRARRIREKNVNAWVYGLYAPLGSVVPDESSAMALGYDPWSIVHPGYFELEPGPYRSRAGRSVRDDRFEDGAQFAAAHLWIHRDPRDPTLGSPRIVVYHRLREVNFGTVSSGVPASKHSPMVQSCVVKVTKKLAKPNPPEQHHVSSAFAICLAGQGKAGQRKMYKTEPGEPPRGTLKSTPKGAGKHRKYTPHEREVIARDYERLLERVRDK